jgi:sialate O-acetylesterase
MESSGLKCLSVISLSVIQRPDATLVGRRLALWALGTVYGKSVSTSGPLPTGHERRGQSIVVSFSHADGGLTVRGDDLTGFEIAGVNGFKPAVATIEGDTVVVASPEVAEPVAVRYAWENNPKATLFNGFGLPASPFSVEVAR